MKKHNMTEERKANSQIPLAENILELLKAATFVAYEADKRGIPREKIDVDMIFSAMKKRKPEEYRFEME